MSELSAETFFNPKLLEDITNTTSASKVIELYTQIILQQGDIKLKALPNLPAHQEIARKNAKEWKEKFFPDMDNTTADTIAYAKTFEKLVKKWPQNIKNTNFKTVVVAGLKELQEELQKNLKSTQIVIKKLDDFYKALAKDSQNFHSEYNQALVKIQGEDIEVKAFGVKLDTIQSDMNKAMCLMATGGGADIIAVGTILALPLTGGTSALISGGAFLALIGGELVRRVGAEDYEIKMNEQKKITEYLEANRQEMTALKSVKSSLEGFLEALKHAVIAAQALLSAWHCLEANLKIVINAIERTDPELSPALIVAQWNAANANWQGALDKAKPLHPDGQMKVKTEHYDNLQDAFKKAKKQG